MTKMPRVPLADYEEKDLIFWCGWYKNAASMLILRIDQYMAAETDEERTTYALLINTLTTNLKEKGIGIPHPYEDGESYGEVQ